MDAQRRAQVWLQLAYLMMIESDSILYAHPRPQGPEVDETLTMLKQAGDRFFDKAKEVAGGSLPDDAWREACDALGRPL